ncbi:hypothetical protein [Aquariibacter albus]|uniref:Uncharacterized protein n=1 Tax=Aquariibacter albus TaxID=2759899 RepID=A0A839HKB9_9BURK|nr:hypothetical protein [Aquariibacter albus]MBB1161482.1 hypothetical protein [Aquariibacter albus]
MENEVARAEAQREADRLLELLIKHQPGLIKSAGLAEEDAAGIAKFIEHLRRALRQQAAGRG